jgi:hypothetical protein
LATANERPPGLIADIHLLEVIIIDSSPSNLSVISWRCKEISFQDACRFHDRQP